MLANLYLFRPIPDVLFADPFAVSGLIPVLRQPEDPAEVRSQPPQSQNCEGAEGVFGQAPRVVVRVGWSLFEHLEVVWL